MTQLLLNSTTSIIANMTASRRGTKRATGAQQSMLEMIIQTAVILAFALAGNAFLIAIMIRGRKPIQAKQTIGGCARTMVQRTTTNKIKKQPLSPVQVLIMHNCLADLMFALLGLLPSLVYFYNQAVYDYNDLTCKFWRMVAVLPMYASAFLLVAISLDRFKAVCRPLSTLIVDKRLKPHIYASIAWSLALLCSLPQIYVFRIKTYRFRDPVTRMLTNQTIGLCHSRLDHRSTGKFYVVYFNAVAWLIPTCLASYLYSRVCLTVWSSLSGGPSRAWALLTMKRHKQQRENRGETDGEVVEQTEAYLKRLHNSDCYRRREDDQTQRRVRTVKLTLAIVSCNFLLWTPFCITNVIVAFSPGLLNARLATYLMLIGNLNSCVNPWIYVLFNLNQVKRSFGCLVDEEGGGVAQDQQQQQLPMTGRTNDTSHRTPPPGVPTVIVTAASTSTITQTQADVKHQITTANEVEEHETELDALLERRQDCAIGVVI